MKKRLLSMLLAAIMILALLTACGSNSTPSSSNTDPGSTNTASNDSPSSETLVLQAGHVLTEDSAYHEGLVQWAAEVEEKTEGRIHIDVFANSILGNERDMIEALQMNTLDITLPNSAPLSNFTEAFRVFDLPFLFQDREEAYKVIDSEIGDNMLAQLDDIGIVGLSIWENGFRYVANADRPVSTPEDLAGLKIRTMENEIHMASFRSWGADATAMAWGEVYTGLEQHTIDGLENPIGPIYQNKLHEVAKYITMTGHFYCPAPLLISKGAWEKISPEDQQIMKELADKYKAVERELMEEFDDQFKQDMLNEGCTIEENVDKQAWRDAAQSVYDEYGSVIGQDLLDQIEAKKAE